MVSLLPEPTITVSASAAVTNLAPTGTNSSAGIEDSLNYSFEVVGPPTQAVPIFTNISNSFAPDGSVCPVDNEGDPGSGVFSECVGAILTSPGFYIGPNQPNPPLMSGQIVIPLLWVVPNMVNEIDLGAGLQVSVGETNPMGGVPSGISQTLSFGLPFPTIAASLFPNAGEYQIVTSLTPEPETWVLVAAGLFALGFIHMWARRP